jgi:hypothetical protein
MKSGTPSVKPKPRPIAEHPKPVLPQESSNAAEEVTTDLVPAAVIRDTFASLNHLLADIKSYYDNQTDMIAQRLDELDRAVTDLENQEPDHKRSRL